MVNIELQGSNLSKFCRKLSGESIVNNQMHRSIEANIGAVQE